MRFEWLGRNPGFVGVGAKAIKKILRSRLPQRLADKLPSFVVEAAIAVAAPVALLGLRLLLHPFAADRAPYSFMFIAIVLATVAAGWRSGLVAVAVGQFLAWQFVVVPAWPVGGPDPHVVGGLILATIAQLFTVLIICLYQREVDKGTAERENRLRLLDDALREIDHRTRNNYQVVLAMLVLQARRATDDKVRDALQQAADRIQAVANASQQLAQHSFGLDEVRLDDHLCGLVEQIERGLSRDGIRIECDVEESVANPDTATSISIIVNELVTNALKHAFNGEGSGHVRVIGRSGSKFELIVTDNGRGIKLARRENGLGTRLVDNFVRQLGAEHEVVSSDNGTTHRLVIPRLH